MTALWQGSSLSVVWIHHLQYTLESGRVGYILCMSDLDHRIMVMDHG